MEAIELLQAKHIGIREMRSDLSKIIKEDGPVVLTDRGRPIKIVIAYDDMLAMMKELNDK